MCMERNTDNGHNHLSLLMLWNPMSSHRHARDICRSCARLLFVTLFLTGSGAVPFASSAEQTGATLTGQVVFRGMVPPPQVVTVTRNPEICGATMTLQPLIVQSRTNGVLNAVVSIDGDSLPPKTDPPEAVTVTNDRCAFSPHVEAVSVGNTLEIGNLDHFLHNTHIRIDTRTFLNVAMVDGGKPVKKILKQPGIFSIRCDIHQFMQGYVLAFNHPYYTVTPASGDFRIVGVPAGRHQITVWHETLGTLQREVAVPAQGELSMTLEFP